MKRTTTLLLTLACMYSPIFELSMQAIAVPTYAQKNAESDKLPEKDLKSIAQEITVRVLVENSQDYSASGILIDKQERQQGQQSIYLYLVLTNDHVLKGLKKRIVDGDRYQIQTFDNQTHKALLYPRISWKGNDLGLLWFSSPNQYKTANLGESKRLDDRDKVFASGFPCEDANSCLGSFTFLSGYAWTWLIVHGKHLDSGYQLGFSNEIREGMSGGPVLDKRGLVVGINGRGKYQQIGFRSGDPSVADVNPYAYMDGKDEPPKDIQNKMESLAWAIPIETYVNYVKNPFDRLELPSPKAGTQSLENQSASEPSPSISNAPGSGQQQKDEGENNGPKYDDTQLRLNFLIVFGSVFILICLAVGLILIGWIFKLFYNLFRGQVKAHLSESAEVTNALEPVDFPQSSSKFPHIEVIINPSHKEIKVLVDGYILLFKNGANYKREVSFSGPQKIKIKLSPKIFKGNNIAPKADAKEYEFSQNSKKQNDDGSEDISWYLHPKRSVSRKPLSITVTFTEYESPPPWINRVLTYFDKLRFTIRQ